ncbi:MAG: thioredoxin family protein [Opitutales bacterium]
MMNTKRIRSFAGSALAAFALLALPFNLQGESGPGVDLATLLDGKLMDAEGDPVSAAELKGKTVGLYFSAHWCPPCRGFTPKLSAFYQEQDNPNFELVFVSADRSQKDAFKYMAEDNMTWYTVEWRSEPANALMESFAVKSIPTLVILNPEGNLITKMGRFDVEKNPDSALAKWQVAGK